MTESFGILSTYPPTQCGLATFTSSLAAALSIGADPAPVGIVEVTEHPTGIPAPEVTHRWVRGVRGNTAVVALALDAFDVAIVQHEYGIYDGWDGDAVLDVLRRVHVPVVTVLHTVLADPTRHQRLVLELVVRASTVAVVMTETARHRLLVGYDVDPTKIELIAHGAPTEWSSDGARDRSSTSTMLTWGLLGPGKGIEWAIDAVALLGDIVPEPRYVIAGETHPRVLERYGDAYRRSLEARVRTLGLEGRVHFDRRYLALPELRALVAEADVVVLPYDSMDQVTSGVLIEAVIARRPVVATAFPHAVELLSSGAGILVPQGDPVALAAAVRRVFVEPGLAASMVAVAEGLAPDLTWASVAESYRGLSRRLLGSAVVGSSA